MNPVVTEKEFSVNYYDIDYAKRALLSSIVNFMVDTSLEQSYLRGVGVDYLFENKLGWIIYKWDIKINKYPMYREKIKSITTPYSFNKFYAYRKFEIINEKNEVLVEAMSEWLMINMEKRRLMRIPEIMYNAYGVDKTNNTPYQFEELKEIEKVDYEKEFQIRYSDIDTNRHVNNVKYIDWAVEVVPLDIVLNYKLDNIKFKYDKEATYGENIKSQVEIIKEDSRIRCLHKITNAAGEKLTLGETYWIKA